VAQKLLTSRSTPLITILCGEALEYFFFIGNNAQYHAIGVLKTCLKLELVFLL
jgi:hypothetical protein